MKSKKQKMIVSIMSIIFISATTIVSIVFMGIIAKKFDKYSSSDKLYF